MREHVAARGSVKTPEEKQRELAAWHSEWERKWRHTIVVDEAWARNEPTQYAETIADMSASAEAEAEYCREANRILNS